MIDQSLAQPARPETPEITPGYVLRGLGLFELHAEEILEDYQGGGRWLVPSGTVSGRLYEVRVGTRPEWSRCECIGFSHHNHCSHVIAAGRVSRLSAVCDACGKRTWRRRGLVEVGEDNLMFYPGDKLCLGCARAHGAA